MGRTEHRQGDLFLKKSFGVDSAGVLVFRDADHDAIFARPRCGDGPVGSHAKEIEAPSPLFEVPKLAMEREEENPPVEGLAIRILHRDLELCTLSNP